MCDDTKKAMLVAPPGVKLLYQMVKDAYGCVPVYPIKPQYVISTDDTMSYIFVGKGVKERTFQISI